MRYSYQCPKCQSKEVVEVVGSSLNAYQKIPLTKWGMKSAVLDRYVCINCGYTEEYVQLNDSFKKTARRMLRDQDRDYDDYV